MFALLLALALIPADALLLGHDEFAVRDEAHKRLTAWAPLSLPYLMLAAQSDDPEIRYRAQWSLRPWEGWCRDRWAMVLLLSPWPVEPLWFWREEDLRIRVQRQARRLGCSESAASWLTPPWEIQWFNWGNTRWNDARWAIEKCRDELGVPKLLR